MSITNKDYQDEILSIATDLAFEAIANNEGDRSAAEDDINDHMLHERIDGHQWVIYYSYNLSVIQHSSNEDYYIDNFGSEGLADVLKEHGLSSLHSLIAFWCMYADVQDSLSDALDVAEQAFIDDSTKET